MTEWFLRYGLTKFPLREWKITKLKKKKKKKMKTHCHFLALHFDRTAVLMIFIVSDEVSTVLFIFWN